MSGLLAASRRLRVLEAFEKNGNLMIETELPAFDKKDVKIIYTEHAVTIQGEAK